MLSLHGHMEQKKKQKLERVFQISQSNTMTEKKGPRRNQQKNKNKRSQNKGKPTGDREKRGNK